MSLTPARAGFVRCGPKVRAVAHAIGIIHDHGVLLLSEYRQLAQRGSPFDVPVLVVGFRPQPAPVTEFHTRTSPDRVVPPPLAVAMTEASTAIIPLTKSGRNPYGTFVFVGRGSTSDVVLRDQSVSKSHAWFEQDQGAWFVRDNRSRNGTLVDARRLPATERVLVTSGAQITFGAFPAYFLEPGALEKVLAG